MNFWFFIDNAFVFSLFYYWINRYPCKWNFISRLLVIFWEKGSKNFQIEAMNSFYKWYTIDRVVMYFVPHMIDDIHITHVQDKNTRALFKCSCSRTCQMKSFEWTKALLKKVVTFCVIYILISCRVTTLTTCFFQNFLQDLNFQMFVQAIFHYKLFQYEYFY